MIPPGSVMRVARPTDNLQAIGQIYAEGLGFEILSQFKDHDGFDGAAVRLGLNPGTLRSRMKKLGITRTQSPT